MEIVVAFDVSPARSMCKDFPRAATEQACTWFSSYAAKPPRSPNPRPFGECAGVSICRHVKSNAPVFRVLKVIHMRAYQWKCQRDRIGAPRARPKQGVKFLEGNQFDCGNLSVAKLIRTIV